jgi:uncharacterized membrane protein YqjE
MESPPDTSPGFVNSVRTLADGVLATLQDRVELVSVELQEEKFRLIQIFIWISAAVFTGVMAITFASITLVYLLWDSARIAALVGLTLLYGGAAVAIAISFRRYLARQPRPFAATLDEIKVDRSCIRTKS